MPTGFLSRLLALLPVLLVILAPIFWVVLALYSAVDLVAEDFLFFAIAEDASSRTCQSRYEPTPLVLDPAADFTFAEGGLFCCYFCTLLVKETGFALFTRILPGAG